MTSTTTKFRPDDAILTALNDATRELNCLILEAAEAGFEVNLSRSEHREHRAFVAFTVHRPFKVEGK